MPQRGIWLGETKDNLRITPSADGNRRAARANQHLARGLNRQFIGMCTYEERPLFEAFLPLIRIIPTETSFLERAGNITGSMSSRFTERC
jgi:hypothetical protein